LHAYQFGIPAYEEIDQGILSALYKEGIPRSNLDFEFLDLRRYPDPNYRDSLAALLRLKYGSRKFDLVIAVALPSITVVTDLRERYNVFEGVPVLGVAIPDDQIPATEKSPLVLITDYLDVRGTVNTALDLLPETKHVLLVSGVSETDKQNEFKAMQDLREWSGRLDVSSLSHLPLDKQLRAVSEAAPHSFILCLGSATDVTGRTYIPAEVCEAVGKASAAPVFGTHTTLVRRGLVGGSVKDYPREGQEAGRVAVRILKGELTLSPAPPPIRIPSLSLFDWRQMKRWGLDETRLPKGSVIENGPVTLWSEHPWFVLGTATFAVLESLLILALSQQVRRRKEAVALLTHELEERKRAEEDRKELQLQLGHAQKMESVGRLAGGVAHDFNNLMNVILLHTDSLSEELQTEDPRFESIEEIQKAAARAVELTQRLMTFSQKRALELEVLNLDSVIAEHIKLVRPLIGENISLRFIPGSGLALVAADSGQIGQIFMNLVLNSRDAMPQGGDLIIETASVELDESAARVNSEVKPGLYVTLVVRDTGVGMDRQTQVRVFEPFFTTKEVGKGTGLGLSVVYGIVKQCNGYITVDSEPGQGTEFRIYLPSMLSTREPVVATEAAPMRGGTETILVAEDEVALREELCRILEAAGYRVLVGKDVDETIRIATQHEGPLDLLLTDVVMPGMAGPRLAHHLQPLHPQMKVVYMSGYPGPFALQPEANVIEKPFTKPKLLRRLREVLDGRERSSVKSSGSLGN